MHKLLEVPRRNFARARLTISLARSSPTKGVILVLTYGAVSRWDEGGGTPGHLLTGGGVLKKNTPRVILE